MCIEVDISKIKDKSIIDKISVNVEKMNMDTEYIDIYAINQSDEFIAYRLKEPVKDHSVTIYLADHSIQKYIIAYVPVNNLSLNYDVINLKKGEEITLTCDLNENATNSQLHAQVRDSNIIEVSSNGTIKAINAGTTQLIIQSYKNSVTKVIDVIVKEIPTDIILDKENIEIEEESSYKINITVLPVNLENKNIKIKSSNDKIATMDKDGTIKAISKGRVTITISTEETPTIEEPIIEPNNPEETPSEPTNNTTNEISQNTIENNNVIENVINNNTIIS